MQDFDRDYVSGKRRILEKIAKPDLALIRASGNGSNSCGFSFFGKPLRQMVAIMVLL
jgi:hypothetical protein